MVMTLKGQGHRSKQMTPSDSFTSKPYLDAKIVILSALVRKLWLKTSFCIMVTNVTRSRTSHVQTAQDIFQFVKRPRPKLPSVKIW